MPSFRQVLAAVTTSWAERRADVEAAADRLVDELRGRATGRADEPRTEPEETAGIARRVAREPEVVRLPGRQPNESRGRAVARALERLVDEFDFEHGGWGGPPRFPQPAVIELLLRRARDAPDDRDSATAVRALDVMADGGIHDQIGGGFHRYATDTDWLVPHFEKMLYDNAQLARVYLHAYQLTGEQRFGTWPRRRSTTWSARCALRRAVCRQPGRRHRRDRRSALTFGPLDEVAAVLAERRPMRMLRIRPRAAPHDQEPNLAELFASAYGVTEAGNWEGRTILSRVDGRRAGRGHVRAPPQEGRSSAGTQPVACCWSGASAGPSRPWTTRR
jgi:uncharacterized protein YyaL (SSP411 family)